MLGVLPSPEKAIGSGFSHAGDEILLIGTTHPGDFGGSDYAKIIGGTVGGRPPALDLGRESALIRFLVEMGESGGLHSAHDPAGGGLAIALSDSALQSGTGFSVALPQDVEPYRLLFSESPSRVLISVASKDAASVEAAARREDLEVTRLGTVGGNDLNYGAFSVPLEVAKETFERALPDRLSGSMVEA
ncbi:MAG: AIR synthase-related protein [Actinomycetota bacterium]